jgi:hypothetical protein
MARIVRANTAESLLAYRTDFWLHDQFTLLYATRPGDEFIWILRDAGTELSRLYQGGDPVLVTHWLAPNYPRNRASHVVCTDANGFGTVVPITAERAKELAGLPQRGPLTLTPRELLLLRHLKNALSAAEYTQSAAVRAARAFVEHLEFSGDGAA